MFKKAVNIIFIILFLAAVVVPLIFANFKNDVISPEEQRYLAPLPAFVKDGHYNRNFPNETDEWINDNIGFRYKMMVADANIRYRIFGSLPESSNFYPGRMDSIHYLTSKDFADYQHRNIYSDEYMEEFAQSLVKIKDYLEEKGASFYYYQCWDKHSIYPEYFPAHNNQYGDKSKTDMIMDTLATYPQIALISPKDELIKEKDRYNTYSKWGDPTHWTDRGAFIGYTKLMESLKGSEDYNINVLSEADYDIKQKDVGLNLFRSIHTVDMEEVFKLKVKNAKVCNEKLSDRFDNTRSAYYTNDNAGNDKRLLLLCDSYFHGYIIEDIAQSFKETVVIWTNEETNLREVIDVYDPDVLVFESAEREDRTPFTIEAAKDFE